MLALSLAFAEMTSILTRLLVRCDFELCDESREWGSGQCAWVVWEKPALYVRMTRVSGTAE